MIGAFPSGAEAESPISYVKDITTPLIIFHGENDRRAGFIGGEMLYRSLKVLGRPVEYVRHPGATHEITRSGEPHLNGKPTPVSQYFLRLWR